MLGWGIGHLADAANIFPAWPLLSSESDFVPVGPSNTNGLIVFAPLRSPRLSTYLQQLITEGFPILFIGAGEPGPTISVDNMRGIDQAAQHLVEHGHRQVAFIAGTPSDQGDSKTRLDAYRSAISKYGMDDNPNLIVWGRHTSHHGYRAMQELIDSGENFTAVIASNDYSGIGAMRAIRETGLRIPDDIALIGFDDLPDAVAQVPSLASVRVPLTLIGEQAMLLMLDFLSGQASLDSVRIPTRLMRRQSCGCIPDLVTSAGMTRPQVTSVSENNVKERGPATLQEGKRTIVEEMLNTLPAELRFPGGDQIKAACTDIVRAFYTSLGKHDSGTFLITLHNVFREIEENDRDLGPWQEIFSVLRREMTQLPAKWNRLEVRALAEDLLHQARIAVSESARRQDWRHQAQAEIAAQALSNLTARLSIILDEHQAVEFLDSNLGNVGIRHAQVALFQPFGDDPVAYSSLLSAKPRKLGDRRFLSRKFPPRGMYKTDELLNIALVPLIFQTEAIGYVAFDASNLGPCASIARQLAATLKSCRLHAQVVQLSLTDPLTGLRNRRYFEIFLQNEVNRSQRYSRSLAIMLVDFDHFKEYNDTYGHPAGDEALRVVAKFLSANRRSTDLVARIGGDEFVIVLPETESSAAEKIGQAIIAGTHALSSLKTKISLSIGLTCTSKINLNAEQLVQEADQALYESKRAGRGQITSTQNVNLRGNIDFSHFEI